MRYILAILFGLALEPTYAADKVAPPDFSRYPQTESFRFFLSSHTNSEQRIQSKALLLISAFPQGDGVVIRYSVEGNGQEDDYRYVYNWAVQAEHTSQLSETNLTALRSAIRELPAASVSPPIERLVIVSFRDGTNWVTRSYDSRALPQPMRQIYDLIGERFETKQQPNQRNF